MRKQLDIFWRTPIKEKTPVYADFTIHEKINFKANELGLHDVFKGCYQYFTQPRYQAVKDFLTSNYWWHHRTNAGGEVRLQCYNQSTQKQLRIFK